MELPNIQELLERTVYHNLRYTTVALGYIPNIDDYDIENPQDDIYIAEHNRYKNDVLSIKNNKGFAIELFNNGPSQQRGILKVPRIVLETESFLPGELGLDTTTTYSKNEDGSFTANDNAFLTQTSDFYFQLRLLTNTVKQQRTLNGIMIKTLPRRGYMRWYGDESLRPHSNIFINFVSHAEYNWQDEGIVEKIYRYEIKDVSELEPESIGNVPAIKELSMDNLDIKFE